MNPVLSPGIRDVTDALHRRPAVSIILPFEPKMNLKSELMYALKVAADKVKREMARKYPADMCVLVMQKLRALISNLNFNTHKKSIAIYVSPLFEKILYLDISVEERVIVDDTFEIRDLVYSKKQLHKYLVLLLSGKESRIYLGNSSTFVRIVSNVAGSINAYIHDAPERVSNFSGIAERKQVLMDKFLHQIDNNLDLVLNAYHLPLFVMGTKRISGHFRKLTKHASAVIEYVHGNYDETSVDQVKKKLEPFVTDWKKVRQKDLLNQLYEAFGEHKLAVGMKEVWRDAMNQKGRLLVVEKNYMYPAVHGSREDVIYKAVEPFNKFSYIKDAVDQVIEQVLENGGDVEFVDDGGLEKFGKVALINYY